MVQEFQTGDLVRLISGGPVMVVEGKGKAKNTTKVTWVNDSGVHREEFLTVLLRKTVPDMTTQTTDPPVPGS